MSYDLGAITLSFQTKGGTETIAEATKLADTLDKKLSPAVQAVVDRLEYYNRVQRQLSTGTQATGSFFSPREIQQATQRMQGFESSLANTRQGMGSFGVVTQQAGYQIGDFFVQVQSGTNWMVAFGQQATQLVGILPMMGAGFLGLSTGGLIALSAGLGIAIPLITAIGAAFLRTRSETDIFNDALNLVKETMDGFNESSDIVNMSLDELIKKYGVAAERVRQFGLAQAELRVSQAESALQDQIPILNDVIDRFAQVGLAGRQALQDIQEEFGTTRFGAIAIRDALMEIKQADSFVAQQEALLNFIDILEQTNTPLSEIPPEIQLAVDQMITLSNATDEARARMEQLRGAAAGMTVGIPLYQQNQSSLLPPDSVWQQEDTKMGSGATKAKEQEDALERLREQLALEQEVLGISEAQARVITALGDQRSKYSEEEIQAITAEIEAYNQKIAVLKQQQQIADVVKSSMEGAFMSMITGTKSVADAFKNMAYLIIQELYKVLVVQQLVGSFNSTTGVGSGIVGAIMGGFTRGPAAAPPGVAYGGSVMPNRPYLVGEKGPELVIPRHSGTVVNANQTANAMGGDGGFTQNLSINVTGSDSAMVRTEIAKMIPQITNATKAAVIDARLRGGQMKQAFK